MVMDTDTLDPLSLPHFLDEAEVLMHCLQKMNFESLRTLWRCNEKIAVLNVERLKRMELRKNLTPAILAFSGLQYRYMSPRVFETGQFDYIERHLRILSGFYGMLRPLDGVYPYRLEMGAKLSVGSFKNLYDFWGDKIAATLSKGASTIVDLASKEYSRAIIPRLPHGIRVLKCVFGEIAQGKIVEKGTLCKMARGEMVRFLAEENITRAESLKDFSRLGYIYSQKDSTHNKIVFLKSTL